jgi:type II secretory pathway pseudopilin PulG
MARPTTAGSQGGIAFIGLLLMIAAMSASLAVAGTIWHQVRQREKESELLFVGMQYRDAIRRYFETGSQTYPPNLEVLLLDPRYPAIRRHLRRPWHDPINGSEEWGLVKAPEGGIMGVHSLAAGTPIKQAKFPVELGWKEGARESYADWLFVYQPPTPTP